AKTHKCAVQHRGSPQLEVSERRGRRGRRWRRPGLGQLCRDRSRTQQAHRRGERLPGRRFGAFHSRLRQLADVAAPGQHEGRTGAGGFLTLRGPRERMARRGATMRPARWGVGIIFAALLGLGGGGKDPPVEVKPQSGLERAKGILNDYANGAAMGSEAETFEEIVEEVRKTDPQKAMILEKGFADLKRSPKKLSDKARPLLKQL